LLREYCLNLKVNRKPIHPKGKFLNENYQDVKIELWEW